MSVERKEYLTQADLELGLPDWLTWEYMLENQVVIANEELVRMLRIAKDTLINTPGPNQERRRLIGPLWFDYWMEKVSDPRLVFESCGEGISRCEKLVSFKKVGRICRDYSSTGVLFVAGAEGRPGHVFSAFYMQNFVDLIIFAFESDIYLKRKDRQAPFLPLPVRLSMWARSPVGIITVLPEAPEDEAKLSSHYQGLFERLNARYCFACETDPYVEEKINRGELLREGGRVVNRIPFLPSPSTTEAVERLFPGSRRRLSRAEVLYNSLWGLSYLSNQEEVVKNNLFEI